MKYANGQARVSATWGLYVTNGVWLVAGGISLSANDWRGGRGQSLTLPASFCYVPLKRGWSHPPHERRQHIADLVAEDGVGVLVVLGRRVVHDHELRAVVQRDRRRVRD